MRRLAIVLGAALLLAGQGGPARAAVSPPPDPGPVIEPLLAQLALTGTSSTRAVAVLRTPARLVVGLRSSRDLARLGATPGVRVVRADRRLRFAVVIATPAAAASLSRAGWVRYARRPARLSPASLPNDPYIVATDPVTGLPYEWQFAAAHADRALELAPGSPDFIIGIIDTGADVTHPDLASKIAGTSGDVTDTVGHGTFVAALAAGAVGDGMGIAGFGGASRLFIVRVEILTDDALASAIRLAADQGVRVINMSFGGTSESAPLADAVGYAASKGVLLIAAAGNELSNSPLYPAIYLQPPSSNGGRSLGLAVGASDQNGNRAFFSNFGDWVSLLAPGGWSSMSCPELGVFSAIPTNQTLLYDNADCLNVTAPAGASRWGYSQGTSFASPEVAGAAALAWSVNPELKNFQVAEVLKQSATRPAGTGWTPDRGWGLLDAAAAVELAARYDSVAPEAVLRAPGRVWADPELELSWSGTDAGFGGNPASGLTVYELFYQADGGPAKPWLSTSRSSKARFKGLMGKTYAFTLRVTDAAGNVRELRPVTVSIRQSKTRIVLRARSQTVKPGGVFHLLGQVRATTPGGASAFGAGVRLNVLGSRGTPGSVLLASAETDADGRFDIAVRVPARGSWHVVVELPETKRLLGAYSPEIAVTSR